MTHPNHEKPITQKGSIAYKLRHVRKGQSMAPEHLAQLTGIPCERLQKIELHAEEATEAEIEAIKKALGHGGKGA
jgi:hypothetical protein